MKIRQLSYFVSAIRLGSLSAVAKEQGVSVQAVSKSMVQLERELGRVLLVREHGGVVPTEFGQRFYERASVAVEQSEQVEAYIESLSSKEGSTCGCEHATLALCMAPSRGGELVCATFASLVRRRFDVEVSMTLMSGNEALGLLRSGALDGAIVAGRCVAPDLDCSHLGSIGMHVLARRGHPLAGELVDGALPLSSVARYPILASGEFEAYIEALRFAFESRGLRVKLLDSCEGASVEQDVAGGDAVMLAADAPLYALMHPTMLKLRIDPETPVVLPVDLVTLRVSANPASLFLRHIAEPGLFRSLFSVRRR